MHNQVCDLQKLLWLLFGESAGQKQKFKCHMTLLSNSLMKFSLPLISVTQKHYGSLVEAKKPFSFISVVITDHLLGFSWTTNIGDSNPAYYYSEPEAGPQVENFHRLILGYFSFPCLNPNLIVTTCFSAEPAVTNLLKNIHCYLTFIYLNKNFSGSPQYCLNLLFQAVFFPIFTTQI